MGDFEISDFGVALFENNFLTQYWYFKPGIPILYLNPRFWIKAPAEI